jgi:hypothetical protein
VSSGKSEGPPDCPRERRRLITLDIRSTRSMFTVPSVKRSEDLLRLAKVDDGTGEPAKLQWPMALAAVPDTPNVSSCRSGIPCRTESPDLSVVGATLMSSMASLPAIVNCSGSAARRGSDANVVDAGAKDGPSLALELTGP